VTPAQPLSYELVTVPRSTSLKQFASRSGIPLESLERLNPELRLKQTPPDGSYRLKVPIGGSALIQGEPEMGPRLIGFSPRMSDWPESYRATPTQPRKPTVHVVKAQETVSAIARRYGVSAADIARWNSLPDGARIHPGERLQVSALGSR
jgi:LysM repeat protein